MSGFDISKMVWLEDVRSARIYFFETEVDAEDFIEAYDEPSALIRI